MKKAITLTLIVISLYWTDRLFHVSDAIVLFLTVGVIPGTNTSLSPDTMLAIIIGVTASIIAGAIFSHTYHYLIVRYHVMTATRRFVAVLRELTQRLDRWYHSVQSLPTKVATPEE